MRRDIDLGDETQYNFIDSIDLIYQNDKTFLEGEDVSKEIRSIPVTRNVSLVSSLKRVRDKMVYFQRKSAEQGLVLMDGRDIGTVVLPSADVKIFLTASPEERAKRRLKELKEKGISSDYETVLEDIKVRDYKDSHRAIAPLKMANDAIEVDTTNLTIDEVCSRIIQIINERMK
jgi:cytidylate kinase